MQRSTLGLTIRTLSPLACLILTFTLVLGCGSGGRVSKKEIEKVDAASAAGPLQGFPAGSDPMKTMQKGKGPGFGDAKAKKR